MSPRAILKNGVNRKVLYVGVPAARTSGKGRKEDHSVVGARIAAHRLPAAGAEAGGLRDGGMAGALSPADVGHGPEA